MADQTVPEQAKHYDHADALDDLRQTAKAASVVRAVSMAVAYEAEMVVRDADAHKLVRWAPSVDAALWCLEKIKTSFMDTIDSPNSVDWCTPLSLLETMAAVFWNEQVPEDKAMCSAQVEELCEVILDTLSTLHDDLSAEASNLKPNPGAAG